MRTIKDDLILSNNLKYLLTKHAVTQKTMRKYLNISATSFSKYYNGYAYPKPDKIKKIADYFKINVNELTVVDLSKKEVNISNKKDLIKAIRNYNKNFTDEQVKTLENIILLLSEGEEVNISWSKKI